MNTNGRNHNSILPEYTWRSLPQIPEFIEPILIKMNFDDIKVRKIDIKSGSAYKYNEISLLSARKV